MQSLQDDNRQRGSVPPTPPEALQPGERERRSSGVPHVVHHMQANARVGHRGEGARALSPVPAQGTRGRVRQLQPVQAVRVVAVRRLQPGQEQRRGTVSGLRCGVRRFRRAAAPPDYRPQETVSLFQMQGKRDINSLRVQRLGRECSVIQYLIFGNFKYYTYTKVGI